MKFIACVVAMFFATLCAAVSAAPPEKSFGFPFGLSGMETLGRMLNSGELTREKCFFGESTSMIYCEGTKKNIEIYAEGFKSGPVLFVFFSPSGRMEDAWLRRLVVPTNYVFVCWEASDGVVAWSQYHQERYELANWLRRDERASLESKCDAGVHGDYLIYGASKPDGSWSYSVSLGIVGPDAGASAFITYYFEDNQPSGITQDVEAAHFHKWLEKKGEKRGSLTMSEPARPYPAAVGCQ